MVVYDTSNASGIDPQATAEAYATARGVPTVNLFGLDFATTSGVANFYQQASVTRAQMLLITQAVYAKLVTIPTHIMCFVFVGDFPLKVTNTLFYYQSNPSSEYSSNVGFFDMFNSLEWFNNYEFTTNEYDMMDISSAFWDGNKYNKDYQKWHYSVGTSNQYKPNMWFNPENLAYYYQYTVPSTGNNVNCYGRVSACIPLTPFVGNSNCDVSDLWTKAIAAENSKYEDWGTCLLYKGTPGGSGYENNPVSRHFLEEQSYEEVDTTNTYYYGFNSTYPETGTSIFTNTLTNKDPNNWVQYMPGDAGFTSTPTNVFFRSPGALSYYNGVRNVEEYGDYDYRDGAICVFSQSYGAAPQSYVTGPYGVPVASGVGQSRCSAAVASGATCSFGVTSEPYVTGDLTTYGLMTNLWYGGNCAEWMMKMYGGYKSDNYQSYVQYPRNWVMYGDPLYAPFLWRKNLATSIKWDTTNPDMKWDCGLKWDNTSITLNPSSRSKQTKNYVENVLANSNSKRWINNYLTVDA